MYYTRDVSDIHPDFITGIFNLEIPMSAAEKKESFEECLTEVLSEECDFNLVCSVHNQISEMVAEHKESKSDEPLKLSKTELKGVLEYCGVGEEKVEKFGERFDEQFGKGARLSPKSIVDVNKFELTTPDVSVKVNPDRTDLVSTQIINGVRYIMIRAVEGVEVNGVSVN